MSVFDQYFEYTSTRLKNEYEMTSRFTHNGMKGQAREKLIEEFLSDVYPQNYIFGTGEILDSNDDTSRQADIVTYDDDMPILDYSGVNHFLSEGVMAHIEVKSDLSGQMESAFDVVDSVKRLEHNVDPPLGIGQPPSTITSCIFAYDGPTKETFREKVVERYEGKELDICPDIICVLDKYIMHTRKEPDIQDIRFYETGERSLSSFFVNLSYHMYKNYLTIPQLDEYMEDTTAPTF